MTLASDTDYAISLSIAAKESMALVDIRAGLDQRLGSGALGRRGIAEALSYAERH